MKCAGNIGRITAVVGMCGAGKSEVTKVFLEEGYEKVYFGGVTMDVLEKRGLEKNSSKYWNACGGKEMRTVILMDDGMIVSSSLNTDTLVNRYEDMIRGGSVK